MDKSKDWEIPIVNWTRCDERGRYTFTVYGGERKKSGNIYYKLMFGNATKLTDFVNSGCDLFKDGRERNNIFKIKKIVKTTQTWIVVDAEVTTLRERNLDRLL